MCASLTKKIGSKLIKINAVNPRVSNRVPTEIYNNEIKRRGRISEVM